MEDLFDKLNNQPDIAAIEYKLISDPIGCNSAEEVEVLLAYSKYINSIGITRNNYPVFLKILGVKNHQVIDALIGTRDPFHLMVSIQPNNSILETCFSFLAKYNPGEMYFKTLSVILGVFQATYSSPYNGYKIYSPSISDVNNLAKHLIEDEGQNNLLNSCILDVIDKFTELEGQNINEEMELLAVHSHNIQNNFFDFNKRLSDIIPRVLLRTEKNIDR